METEIKKVNSLEECIVIKPGEIIGVGQLITATIPARCISNDGKNIELIGNMDNEVMIKYNFVINEIEGFYDDGSIFTKLDKAVFIEKKDKEFDNYKKMYETGALN